MPVRSTIALILVGAVILPAAYADSVKFSDGTILPERWIRRGAIDPIQVMPQPQTSMLYVTPSAETTPLGERILNLDLLVDGKVMQRLPAISGRPKLQALRIGRDSKRGSEEPLPQGTYRVGAVDRGPGLAKAIGNTFIPILPMFFTTRKYLGIHRDADRAEKDGAGTLGCLALLNQQDIDTVAEFVTTHRVNTLVVDYGLPQR